MSAALLYESETYALRGAIFEVYNQLGSGFLEAVYQESLEYELSLRQIPFIPQPELQIAYKTHQLRQTYRPDFICNDKIIIELKAIRELTPIHTAQMFNYLKATGLRVGLLVNFSASPTVHIERLAV
jgi:GxxExxY protein